jgi:hypothetical protein
MTAQKTKTSSTKLGIFNKGCRAGVIEARASDLAFDEQKFLESEPSHLTSKENASPKMKKISSFFGSGGEPVASSILLQSPRPQNSDKLILHSTPKPHAPDILIVGEKSVNEDLTELNKSLE